MRLWLAVLSGRNISRWTCLTTAPPCPSNPLKGRTQGHSRMSQLCPSRVLVDPRVLEWAARLSQCLDRAILELLGAFHAEGCSSELTSVKILPSPTCCEMDQLNDFGPLAAASRPSWLLH